MNSPLMIDRVVAVRREVELGDADQPERVLAGRRRAGISLAGGAFALLGTGSVALVSVQVFGAASFRQPVTLTISTFVSAPAPSPASGEQQKAGSSWRRMITP